MGYYAIEDETEDLQHHGIKGQRWGVRRFQRSDGTRTPAGKAREREDYDERPVSASTSSGDVQNGSSRPSIDKKKLATGVAIAGAVALGAVLIANPGARNVITKYGKTAVTSVKDFATSDKTKEALKKAGKNVGERISKTGNAMLDAALVSTGAIAISKLEKKLEPGEDASEFEKDRNKLILDTAKAGINSATGASNSKGNKNNTWSDRTGTHVGKEIGDKIGPPSNQNVDRSSKAWQDLFKDQNGNMRDADTRATIKSMANAGYDIYQIDKWLNHSDLDEWIHASEFGSYIVS